MPGDDLTPVVPGGGFDFNRASDMIESVSGTLASVANKLGTGIVTKLSQAEAVCRNIETMLLGRAGVTLDKIEAVCTKIADKVNRAQSVKMTEIYTYMANAGLPIPTYDELQYFGATGQIIDPTVQPISAGIPGNNPPSGPQPISAIDPGTSLPIQTISSPDNPPVGGSFPINPCVVGHMGPNGVCVPDYPGQWGPCTGGGWPDPVKKTCGDVCPPGTAIDPTSGGCTSLPGGGGNDFPPNPPPTAPPGDCPLGMIIDPTGGSIISANGTPITPQGIVALRTKQYGSESFGCSNMPVSSWGSPESYNENGVASDGNNYPRPYMVNAGTTVGDLEFAFEQGWFVHPYFSNGIETNQYQSLVIVKGNRVWLDPVTGFVYESAEVPPGMCPILDLGAPPVQIPPACIVPPGEKPPPDMCYIPPGPDCTKGPESPAIGPPRDTNDICEIFDDVQRSIVDAKFKISDFIGMAASPGTKPNALVQMLFGAIGVPDAGALPVVISRFAAWAQQTVENLSKILGCDIAAMAPVAIYNACLHLLKKYTDIVPEQVNVLLEQVSNTLCQSHLPSAAEANNAWLKGGLTQADWECYTKAEGHKLPHAAKIRDAEQERTTAHDAIHLLNRGFIDDAGFKDRIRKKGVLDDNVEKDIRNMAVEWPHMADLVQFMSRHVNNDEAIADGDLDRNFDANFNGLIKTWADGAGVSEDLARFHWRAHWMKVPYTTLREMLHRLRPTKYGKDMAVDRDLMRRQLIQDDYMPGFVDRLMEISYLPITEGDTKHQYMLGLIDDDQLPEQLMDVSKSPDDAKALAELFAKTKRLHDARAAGFPSLSQLVELSAECLIDPGTFNNVSQLVAENDEQLQLAQQAIAVKSHIYRVRVEIEGIKISMRLGGITPDEATQQLLRAGVDPTCVPTILRKVQEQAKHTPKEQSAGQLCDMRMAGIIGESEQAGLLTKSGFAPDAVARMVSLCTYQLDSKISKAAQRAIRDAEKALATAERAAAKARRDAAKCPPKPCPKPK